METVRVLPGAIVCGAEALDELSLFRALHALIPAARIRVAPSATMRRRWWERACETLMRIILIL